MNKTIFSIIVIMYKKIKDKLSNLDVNGRQVLNFAVLLSLATVFFLFLFELSRRQESFLFFVLIYLLLGILKPSILKYPYLLWMLLSFILGEIVFKLLFTFFYFLLILPIGILLKIFRGDFLHKKYEQGKESYWLDYDSAKPTKESLEKLY